MVNVTYQAERLGISIRSFLTGTLKPKLMAEGWNAGSDLEMLAANILSGFRFKPSEVKQQYAVRPEGCRQTFRLDFAWPEVKVALEMDGWHHRSPTGATNDRARDSWLRHDGWLVFRVDDEHGEDALADQLLRVVKVVRMLKERP